MKSVHDAIENIKIHKENQNQTSEGEDFENFVPLLHEEVITSISNFNCDLHNDDYV